MNLAVLLSLLALLALSNATTCNLDDLDTDTADMCNSCLSRKKCSKMFGIDKHMANKECGTVGHKLFKTTYHLIRETCDKPTNLTGHVQCEVLGMIAESLLSQCGPACSSAEYVRVNANENAFYCACDGKCLYELTDNTLNVLVGALIGLLGIQFAFNFISMIDATYSFGLFGSRVSVAAAAIVGSKTV